MGYIFGGRVVWGYVGGGTLGVRVGGTWMGRVVLVGGWVRECVCVCVWRVHWVR